MTDDFLKPLATAVRSLPAATADTLADTIKSATEHFDRVRAELNNTGAVEAMKADLKAAEAKLADLRALARVDGATTEEVDAARAEVARIEADIASASGGKAALHGALEKAQEKISSLLSDADETVLGPWQARVQSCAHELERIGAIALYHAAIGRHLAAPDAWGHPGSFPNFVVGLPDPYPNFAGGDLSAPTLDVPAATARLLRVVANTERRLDYIPDTNRFAQARPSDSVNLEVQK